MKYRINFGNDNIPEEIRKKFPKGMIENKGAYLQGVCNSFSELGDMVVQADNGRRVISWNDRMIEGVRWYGIYC